MNKEIKSLLLCLTAFLAGMLVIYTMGCNDTDNNIPYTPVQQDTTVLDIQDTAVLNSPPCPNPFCDCGMIAWTDLWCDYHAGSIKKYGWSPDDIPYYARDVSSPK